MFTSLFAKSARRTCGIPLRCAALATVETLETRRMFAGYGPDPLFDPILDPTPEADAGAGLSIAARGNLILVGDTLDDSAGSNAGLVRLYDGSGGIITTFQANDANAEAGFGSQVAFIDDDTFAVSAVEDGIGKVYVFDTNNPSPTASFVPDVQSGFGRRLLGYNNKLIITASGFVGLYDPANPSAAPVVFEDPDTVENPDDGGFIGESLAVSQNAVLGDRLFIGFNRSDTFAGYVAEFDPNDATPEVLHRYQAHVPGDFSFGFSSLAATSTDLFVSSTDYEAVYQFARGGSTPIVYSEAVGGTFGAKLAISGDTLIVTAPGASNTGAVYSYTIGNPADEAVLANPASARAGVERFGDAVAVLGSGNLVVLDTEYDTDTVANAGAVYVFAPAAEEQVADAALDANGNLVVTGTGAADTIEIRSAGAGAVDVYFGDVLFANFSLAAGKTITVNGGGDADSITVNGDVNFDAHLFGEAGADVIVAGGGNDLLSGGVGNDHLTSRNGSDILVGGDDNDTLLGGNGRDVLIGGTGADSLAGDNAEDILVAGSLAIDETTQAGRDELFEIRTVWNSSLSWSDRVASLSLAMIDDGSAVDTLVGGTGQDYLVFTAGVDIVIGMKANEELS